MQDTLSKAINARDKLGIDSALLAGADINDVDVNSYRWSPLSILVQCYHNPEDGLDIAKYLLSKGASPDTRDRRGRTPLFWAVKFNSTEMVKVLAPYVKDPHPHDGNGVHAVTMAGHKSNAANIKMLLDLGAHHHQIAEMGKNHEHEHIRRLFETPAAPPKTTYGSYGSYSSTAGVTEL